MPSAVAAAAVYVLRDNDAAKFQHFPAFYLLAYVGVDVEEELVVTSDGVLTRYPYVVIYLLLAG